jgi:hypothetical protein
MGSHKRRERGLWARLCNWLRPAPNMAGVDGNRYIQVWDAGRAKYRLVDLTNQHDSLWPVAYELALLQARQSARPAA